MKSNLDNYIGDLDRLIDLGSNLLLSMQHECYPKEFEKTYKAQFGSEYKDFIKELPNFSNNFQSWYSEAFVIIKLLLPDRLNDFVYFYEKPKTRKEIVYGNYVISDYLQSIIVTQGGTLRVGTSAAIPQFEQQFLILESVKQRFKSKLFDLKRLIQADLFGTELETAEELIKKGFFRAAGSIAGVVLEKHLFQVSQNHNLLILKKEPTINDLNEFLKKNEVIDVSQLHFIQHLGDIRNLCAHNKIKEPTLTDSKDLIDGVNKVVKTIF